MARLGLDINLALQRLLGANKERAAANRSELEDRKLRKENAAEKAQLAADAARPGSPTGAEEIRGGTPKLYRAPEPAAQRRRKLRVIGVDFNDLHEDPNSVLQSDIDWPASRYSYTDPPNPTTTPSTRSWNNNYYIRDLLIFASVAKDPTKNGQLSYTSLETFNNAIRYFEWTFRHASERGFYNDEPRLVSTPPALDLPFELSDSRVVRAVGKALASCQGKDVYITRLIRVARPQAVWLNTAEYTYSLNTNTANVYAESEDTSYSPLVTGRMAGEEGLRFDNRNYGPYTYAYSNVVDELLLGTDFSMHDANMLEYASNDVSATAGSLARLNTEYVVYDYIALTWTYSGTTNTGSFTANTIRSYTQTFYLNGLTPSGEDKYDEILTETTGSGDVQYRLYDMNVAAAAAFLDALPVDNPNRELWANYLGNSLEFIRDGRFDGPTFGDDRWPSHINYNPTTGVAHAALQIGDRYKVYTYRYTPALTYRQVSALLPKPSDPESEYISRGWRQALDTPAKGLGASLSGTGFTYTMPMI